MKEKHKRGQLVYFLISGRIITEAVVMSSSSWFVTIWFKKSEDCIIRLPHNRIFATKEEAHNHVRPDLPPMQPTSQNNNYEYECTRRWDLWE